jgi:hypothetical protein
MSSFAAKRPCADLRRQGMSFSRKRGLGKPTLSPARRADGWRI